MKQKRFIKRGYKVVWRSEWLGQEPCSLQAMGWSPMAIRSYPENELVEPLTGAGPLHVMATLKAAKQLAKRHTWINDGAIEIWEVEWWPWRSKLPRTSRAANSFGEPAALAGWSPCNSERFVCAHELPPGTRLAEAVIMRRRVCSMSRRSVVPVCLREY